jgi:hypothetical protein
MIRLLDSSQFPGAAVTVWVPMSSLGGFPLIRVYSRPFAVAKSPG